MIIFELWALMQVGTSSTSVSHWVARTRMSKWRLRAVCSTLYVDFFLCPFWASALPPQVGQIHVFVVQHLCIAIYSYVNLSELFIALNVLSSFPSPSPVLFFSFFVSSHYGDISDVPHVSECPWDALLVVTWCAFISDKKKKNYW